MLSIANLSYYIGSRTIFENTSFHINEGDKVGLVGLNGSGKTTLLRIINSESLPDIGQISKTRDCTIGYLNQDLLSLGSSQPILEFVMEAYRDIINLEHRINLISEQLVHDHDPKLINELAILQDSYEIQGGYRIHSNAQEILEGIGFKTEDLTRPINEFSGGWRMRVILAKLLLEKPMLLMLDEPTNHLDLPSIQWLEEYLKSYKGALILVSHDQQFLNNIVTSIIEVSSQKLNLYQGNYYFYREQKELRSEVQRNAYVNQQKMIKDTERFIERFRAKSTKAKQVQSKIKALGKIDLVDEVTDTDKSISFNFRFKTNPGRSIIQLKDVSKHYDSVDIFQKTDAFVEKGNKIALIGANGKGKSTLLRILGGIESFEGERKIGHNVSFSFYAQHQLEALHLENDLITELSQAGSSRTENELRTLLGCFLFSGDDIYKKIKVLSGGEKARVALAKVILSDANLLLLDEPTNHLDFFSIDILKRALQQYQGTVVLVSHDRQFIEDVCNKIWYIEKFKIKEYPGKLSEYLYSQQLKIKSNIITPSNTAGKKTNKNTLADRVEQKEYKKELRSLKKGIDDIDAEIKDLEKAKEEIESSLSDPTVYTDSSKVTDLTTRLSAIEKNIDDLQIRWIEAYNKLEKMSAGGF
jgi:ATP-binding cassette subfamily F protein 3